MAIRATTYQAIIITAIKQETAGVRTFMLASEDGSAIRYEAGQFITFVFTHHGREERRSFSIASHPSAAEPLSITVKRVDNGIYSRFLHDKARVGDTLLTTGTAGLFVLPADMTAYKQVFFFAAGIGITPIFSMIKSLLMQYPLIQVTLIYSNSAPGATVFKAELDSLLKRHPVTFNIEYLYSNAFDLSRARLSKELVPVLVKEHLKAPATEVLCYTCGPYAYMRMVIYALEETGIPAENIRKENFNTDKTPVIKKQPPDTEAHLVTVLHNGTIHEFQCQYPDTILQAAKHKGISLPYSCESGRCGSCAAICKSGQVWLSYNEVLTDLDIRHGSILTCTGYPVESDIVIEV